MIMFPNTFTTICQRPICSLSLPLEMSNLQKHIIQMSVLIFVLQHLISDQIRLSYYSILIIISSSIHTDVCSITSDCIIRQEPQMKSKAGYTKTDTLNAQLNLSINGLKIAIETTPWGELEHTSKSMLMNCICLSKPTLHYLKQQDKHEDFV